MGKLYPQSLYDVLSSIVDNVYFTPPERLQYPCIICDVDDIEMVKADDKYPSRVIRQSKTIGDFAVHRDLFAVTNSPVIRSRSER